MREVNDYICCKPHAAPMDHALQHQLGLFGREDGTWLSSDEARGVMSRLRKNNIVTNAARGFVVEDREALEAIVNKDPLPVHD